MHNNNEIAFINACINGYVTDVEYILKNHKIDVNLGIVYACQSGNIDIVKILLQYGADPNYIDINNKKWTPILATMIGNNWDNYNKDDIINKLIKYGGIIQYWFFDYINNYRNLINTLKQSKYSDYYRLKYIF